jgi:hypothetical protein
MAKVFVGCYKFSVGRFFGMLPEKEPERRVSAQALSRQSCGSLATRLVAAQVLVSGAREGAEQTFVCD